MKLLPEIDQGFEAVMANKENIVKNINATMTFFPLCCSTGVLKGVAANNVSEHDKSYFDKPTAIAVVDVSKVKSAKYIYEIIAACSMALQPIFYPISFARWNALSKILVKVTKGTDDGPSGGYNNYKAAQIVMFDRIVADKRNPKFRFNSYNTTFSVDQLMDWLEAQGGALGEVYVSPPKPGGHGAKVRGCIYTPDEKVLQAYHDTRLEIVRNYVLEYLARKPKGTVKKVADKIAASW